MRRRLKHIKKKILLVGIVPVIFLVLGIWTLPHYGMNWDEPYRFMRGQAYLHYYLTGEKDYKSLPSYPRLNPDCPKQVKNCSISPQGPFDTSEYWGNITYEEAVLKKLPPGQGFRRSYYQQDNYTFPEIVAAEEGHPPFGDILAALTNKIFYQHLNIIGDIEGYHLFEVLASFAIVLGAAVFVYYHYGVFASIVAAASLASYPLFFSESHFNIKDPPEVAFFGLTIITLYFGIVKNKWKLVITSAVLAGMAMGIKFNAAFLPLIVIPWAVVFAIKLFLDYRKRLFKPSQTRRILPILLSLAAYPFIVGLTFYVLWPALWSDPISQLLTTINFYKQIGIGTPPELKDYIFHRWNTYSILWIFYTTPIPILVLSAVGALGSLFEFFLKRKHFVLLILLWFLVPIVRVSWPGSAIYGGVRQIMEFIPALAVLAGFGGFYLARLASLAGKGFLQLIAMAIIIVSLLFVVYENVQIHPNENVYFNQIIGGLSGARVRKIPYWGNSYGNVYQQGIAWLNANAEPGAKVGLPVSTAGNIAKLKLRPDIFFLNAHWSGPNKGGEYEIELDFDWAPKEWYSYAYYDTFVDPVYVAQVDGVALLKIWKNDLAHTRPGYEKEIDYRSISQTTQGGQLKIDMGKTIPLTRVVIEHGKTNCSEQHGGYIATSEDGENWKVDPETIAAPQVPVNVTGWDEDTFVFLFAARQGRYILLDTRMDDSCILRNPKVVVKGLAQN